jgi:hypothetical protein
MRPKPLRQVVGRPLLEHDRLAGRHPVETAGGDRAVVVVDVLGDGDVVVVGGQLLAQGTLHGPEVREARVDVDEDGPSDAATQGGRGKGSADVDQRRGVVETVEQRSGTEAGQRRAVVVDQGRGVAGEDLVEVADGIGGDPIRVDLLDEGDIEAEAL